MGFFTSGLSVKEFALLDRLGPEPLAQVMGASVVQTGWQYLPALTPGSPYATLRTGYGGRGYAQGPSAHAIAFQNRMTDASLSQVRNYQWRASVVCELDVWSDAWNLARRQALDRLTEEALEAGADAVVGVELTRGDHDLGRGMVDYVVTGTAIRVPGSTGAAWPALTDLSVQDYWRLWSAGHEPVGLLATTTVVFASPAQATRVRRLRTTRQNQELDELSRGFHAARDTVRARLRGQVADAHGAGGVGLEFDHSVRRAKFELASSLRSADRGGWHRGRLGIPYRISGGSGVERSGWMITMHAAGTAIRRRPGAARTDSPATTRLGLR